MSKCRLEADSDALIAPAVSLALDAAVVVMWLIPDRRMERVIRG